MQISKNIIIMGKWFLGSPGPDNNNNTYLPYTSCIRRRWRSTMRYIILGFRVQCSYTHTNTCTCTHVHTVGRRSISIAWELCGYRVIDVFGWHRKCIRVYILFEFFAQKQLPCRPCRRGYLLSLSLSLSLCLPNPRRRDIKERGKKYNKIT